MATGAASPKCFPPSNSNDSTYSLDKWDLSIGLVIYRMPVVMQSISKVEKRFSGMCTEKAEQVSLKSDYEL
uniref:Uncharacterized protein n=1 Tax=Ditylenchus dipsaci TaxID=166011 RepID=A0A915EUQ9_9BILA